MNEPKYNYDELRNVVTTFREAIVIACKNRDFDRKDRMSNFPGGCCDDACDLLSYYLYDEFGIRTRQGNGLYDDGVFENRTNHAWLVMDDGTVIDITGTQFRFCAGFTEDDGRGAHQVHPRRGDGLHQAQEPELYRRRH